MRRGFTAGLFSRIWRQTARGSLSGTSRGSRGGVGRSVFRAQSFFWASHRDGSHRDTALGGVSFGGASRCIFLFFCLFLDTSVNPPSDSVSVEVSVASSFLLFGTFL